MARRRPFRFRLAHTRASAVHCAWGWQADPERIPIERKTTTPSEENYVECLYRYSMEGPVRPSLLAEKLGVKRPSVTRAMSMLAKKGLVHHEPYGALKLTKAGRALGRAIVRRDDCLTALLVEVLGMSPEQADPQVHRLEHLVSDDLLVRLESLVEEIRASKPWRRKLQQRIADAARHQNDTTAYDPGRATVHGGSHHER